MSGFTDMMIENGFSDPQEYMDYLESKAMNDSYEEPDCENEWEGNDYQTYDDYDYSEEGCGEGFSCNECGNYGCPAHPCKLNV
jgi:hypothetical protein